MGTVSSSGSKANQVCYQGLDPPGNECTGVIRVRLTLQALEASEASSARAYTLPCPSVQGLSLSCFPSHCLASAHFTHLWIHFIQKLLTYFIYFYCLHSFCAPPYSSNPYPHSDTNTFSVFTLLFLNKFYI